MGSITDQVTIAGWGYLEGTVLDYATIASRETGTSIDQHYHLFDPVSRRGAALVEHETDTMLLQGRQPACAKPGPHRQHLRRDDGAPLRRWPAGDDPDVTGRSCRTRRPFILGGNGNGAGDTNVTEHFPGRIDEVMLLRRALSAPRSCNCSGILFASAGGRDAGARD